MNICPRIKNVDDAIKLNLSQFPEYFSQEEIQEIVSKLTDQKGGGCQNDSDRNQARIILSLLFGAIIVTYDTVKWVLEKKKRKENKDLSFLEIRKNEIMGRREENVTGIQVIDRGFVAIEQGIIGTIALSASIIFCLGEKFRNIYGNISQHLPELKEKIYELILNWAESRGGSIYTIPLYEFVAALKNYIMYGIPNIDLFNYYDPLNISYLFEGIENMLCDFITTIHRPIGGRRKRRKTRKYKKTRRCKKSRRR
jgi:hypothetical protein